MKRSSKMIQCIIFDLSEVLIAGLVGIEKELSRVLPIPEHEILPRFGGEVFHELLIGNISEDTYLRQIIAREGCTIGPTRLKAVIRDNFHHEVEGSLSLVAELATGYELVLLSDHAREWVAYIRSNHPFMRLFEHAFFSFDLKRTKKDPQAFLQVLDAISIPPSNCLFVDDNPHNVDVAESVGIAGIHFLDARQLAAELEKRQV